MYLVTITQQFELTNKEYKRLYKLIQDGHNILLVKDRNGNNHLIDWSFVVNSHSEHLAPEIKPDSLPEMD